MTEYCKRVTLMTKMIDAVVVQNLPRHSVTNLT